MRIFWLSLCVIFFTCQPSKAEEYNFDELSQTGKSKTHEQSLGLSGESQKALSRHQQTFKEEEIARRKAAEERARLSGSTPGNSANDLNNQYYCQSGDICFQVIRNKDGNNYGDTFIKCLNGPSTGEEKCISYSKSTGKYATACFVVNGHHYTLQDAGNSACK